MTVPLLLPYHAPHRKPNRMWRCNARIYTLHFFEIACFDPDQSFGSCLVLTSDLAELHRAFATGMRATYGKVLISGTPRMTRPRARRVTRL